MTPWRCGAGPAQKVDRRHLYLAKEGNIKPSSETAALMPSADLAKRRRAQRDKRTKLRNPLFFVSPTRLSVRNISAAVTDGELKDLFHKVRLRHVREAGTPRPLLNSAAPIPQHRRAAPVSATSSCASMTCWRTSGPRPTARRCGS